MEFNIESFLAEQMPKSVLFAKQNGLSKSDAEDVSQEIAAEFYIKYAQNRVETSNSINAYWFNIQKWRTSDKLAKQRRRESLFLDVGDDNDLDSIPCQRFNDRQSIKIRTLRAAVIKLKNSEEFKKSLCLQKGLRYMLESCDKKTKSKGDKNLYVNKYRVIQKIKEIINGV